MASETLPYLEPGAPLSGGEFLYCHYVSGMHDALVCEVVLEASLTATQAKASHLVLVRKCDAKYRRCLILKMKQEGQLPDFIL